LFCFGSCIVFWSLYWCVLILVLLCFVSCFVFWSLYCVLILV
jgi:hypothetical protein